MILEDFVMLGTTVPEPNSDGRVFVCSAGVSKEYGGLIRVYPLARRSIPRRWHTYRVRLELNPKDSRPQSYKIAGNRSCEAHEDINKEFEVSPGKAGKESMGSDRIRLLAPYKISSIKEANEKRLSLAIIEPKEVELFFEYNPRSPESPQLALFSDAGEQSAKSPPSERARMGAKRFPFIPRLRFTDEAGEHRLMLRDWGCYELMRKMPERRAEMAEFLRLSSTNSSLLVGNLNHRRTAWLVISVLNGIRETPNLLSELENDAWGEAPSAECVTL